MNSKKLITLVAITSLLVLAVVFFGQKNASGRSEQKVLGVSTATHPFLLYSDGDITSIRTKAQSGPSMVVDAFSATDNPSGDPHKILMEASFNYSIGGNPARLAIAQNIMNNLATNGFDGQVQNPGYGAYPPCTALAISYDLLYDDLTLVQKNNVEGVLNTWGNNFYGRYQGAPDDAASNFDTGVIGCLGLIGLVMRNDTWANFAADALRNHYFGFAYNPGGDYWEGNNYQYYGFGSAILFADAYRRVKDVDIIGTSGIMKMWEFLTYAYMSDRQYARYGDNSSDTRLYGEALYIIAKIIKDNVDDPKIAGYLWLWQEVRGDGSGGVTSPPAVWNTFDYMSIVLYYPEGGQYNPVNPSLISQFTEGKIFPSAQNNYQGATSTPGGMVSLRTGWGQSSISLWLTNRWRYQTHQHYDPNNLLISAYGQALFSSYNDKIYGGGSGDVTRGRLYMANSVISDAWYGNPPHTGYVNSNSAASLGMFKRFDTDTEADFIVSDSRYPLSNFSQYINLPNDCTPYSSSIFSCVKTALPVEPFDAGERSVFLVKDMFVVPYVLVYDKVDSNKDTAGHNYSWTAWYPNTAGAVSGNASISNPFRYSVNGVGMSTTALYPPNAGFDQPTDPNMLAGRTDRPFTIISSNVQTAEFLVLAVPIPVGGGSGPIVAASSSTTEYSVYTVNQGGSQNQIILNKTNPTTVITAGDITTDAKLLVLNYVGSAIDKGIIHDGTYIDFQGKRIFNSAAITTEIFKVGEPVVPPSIREGYFHQGIDIKPLQANAGSNLVYTTHAGFVTYAGPAPVDLKEKGWLVQVESDVDRDNIPDFITRYTHLVPGKLFLNDVRNRRVNYTVEFFMSNFPPGMSKLPFGYGPYVARNQLIAIVGDSGSPGKRHIQYEIVTDAYVTMNTGTLDEYSCLDNPYIEVCSTDLGRPGFFFPINRLKPQQVRAPFYVNGAFVTPSP